MPTVNLTSANDTYTYGVAGAATLIVNGRGGNDTITTTANTGRTTINTLAGDDTLTTGSGNDTIMGANGNNTINAGGGNNIVNTGAAGGGTAGISGDTGGTGDDSITTLGGRDTIRAGNGNNTVSSGAGIDLVITGAGQDMITTGPGDDVIRAGKGDDTMVGGSGNDLYHVSSAGDVVTEQFNQGFDRVRSAVSYILGEDVESLTLNGGGAINGTGNALDNILTGNGANNVMNGGLGNDVLDGRGGADTINGGGGKDTLVWGSSDVFDGGIGNSDTLRVSGSGKELNFRTLPNGTIANVERIDLTGSGNNTLTLNVTEVLDLSSTSNTLRVYGDAGDTVHRGGAWTHGADQVHDGNTYESYTHGLATLLVDSDITIVG